jgi:hypothetical protein
MSPTILEAFNAGDAEEMDKKVRNGWCVQGRASSALLWLCAYDVTGWEENSQ